ncbi:MAG TPA: DUF1176 domain-containing protein [Pyrinomonadaceae bacterium]
MTKTTARSLVLLPAALFAVACAPQENAGRGNAKEAAAAKAETTTAGKPSPTPPTAARASLPPTEGKLTPADRKAWREIIRWPEECEEAFAGTAGRAGDNAGLEFFELGEGRRLLKVLCAGGAYQPSQVFAVVNEAGATPSAKVLTFDVHESPEDGKLEKTSATELWGLADFDARTKQLKVHNRFRGPGDCGTLSTYSFDDAGPVLKELRADTLCDGKGAENPEQWKKVTPAP